MLVLFGLPPSPFFFFFFFLTLLASSINSGFIGLPPSPPLPPDAGIIDGEPYSGNNNNARAIKPLGVDVHGKRHKHVLSGGVIAIIVMSVLVVVVLCSAVAWVLLFKHGDQASQRGTSPQHPQTSYAKPSGYIYENNKHIV